MNGGSRLVRGREAPASGLIHIPVAPARLDLGRPWPLHRNVARRAFLQHQFGRLDHRFGMESGPHAAIQQGIGDGDDGHALVMGHEGAHHCDLNAVGDAARRIIQCLVIPIAPPASRFGQARQIGGGSMGGDHGGKRARIGRHDHVLAEPALQPRPGTPKFEY